MQGILTGGIVMALGPCLRKNIKSYQVDLGYLNRHRGMLNAFQLEQVLFLEKAIDGSLRAYDNESKLVYVVMVKFHVLLSDNALERVVLRYRAAGWHEVSFVSIRKIRQIIFMLYKYPDSTRMKLEHSLPNKPQLVLVS